MESSYPRFSILMAILVALFGCTAPPEIPRAFQFSSHGYDVALSPSVKTMDDVAIPAQIKIHLGVTAEMINTRAERELALLVFGQECGLQIDNIHTSAGVENNAFQVSVIATYSEHRCTVTSIPKVICEEFWIKLPFGVKTKGPDNCRVLEEKVTQKIVVPGGRETFLAKFSGGADIRNYSLDVPENAFRNDRSASSFVENHIRSALNNAISTPQIELPLLFKVDNIDTASIKFGSPKIQFEHEAENISKSSRIVLIYEANIPRESYILLQNHYDKGHGNDGQQ